MKFLKPLCFMVAGAGVMFGCLLWMSQFFTNEEERIPVIWLNTGERQEEPSSPWLAR